MGYAAVDFWWVESFVCTEEVRCAFVLEKMKPVPKIKSSSRIALYTVSTTDNKVVKRPRSWTERRRTGGVTFGTRICTTSSGNSVQRDAKLLRLQSTVSSMYALLLLLSATIDGDQAAQ